MYIQIYDYLYKVYVQLYEYLRLYEIQMQMNLKMIRPKTETEDLLLSLTKNCKTLVEQTHRKAEETLEIKMIKSREIFHFNLPFQIKGEWMIGLTGVEVHNSILNVTEENNKFKL